MGHAPFTTSNPTVTVGGGRVVHLICKFNGLTCCGADYNNTMYPLPGEQTVTCRRCLASPYVETARQDDAAIADEETPVDEAPALVMDTASPAKQHWAAMDMAAANGTTVMQGHADYCAANGHARYFVEGGAVDQTRPFCPRCGERATPIADSIRVSYTGGGNWDVYELSNPTEVLPRKHLGTLCQGFTQAWTARKANGDRALINNHLEYGGPRIPYEIALMTGWWN